MNSRMQITVITDHPTRWQQADGRLGWSARCGEHGGVVSVPVGVQHAGDAERKPKSPTRLTRKALRLAKIAVGFEPEADQQVRTRPTASQPKNSCRKLLLITSISIEKVNSEM